LVHALRRLAPSLEATGWIVELGVRDESNTKHERRVVIMPAPLVPLYPAEPEPWRAIS
jgi:hypothetical protein